MKRLLVLCIVFVAACVALSCQAGGTIVIRADVWQPFNGDPASDRPGYGVEIVKAIFEPQGYTIDYKTAPWARALAEVADGSIDAVIGCQAADVPGCVLSKETMTAVIDSFFVLKSTSWTYKGLESLKQVRMGTINGYTYTSNNGPLDHYIQDTADPTVQKVSGDDALEKNIKKLFAGRIDVIIEVDTTLAWTMKKLQSGPNPIDPEQVKCVGHYDDVVEMFMAFSPKRDDAKKLAAIYDAGIIELRKSGKLKKILERYGVPDWKK